MFRSNNNVLLNKATLSSKQLFAGHLKNIPRKRDSVVVDKKKTFKFFVKRKMHNQQTCRKKHFYILLILRNQMIFLEIWFALTKRKSEKEKHFELCNHILALRKRESK